jgi:hypothetical protein
MHYLLDFFDLFNLLKLKKKKKKKKKDNLLNKKMGHWIMSKNAVIIVLQVFKCPNEVSV